MRKLLSANFSRLWRDKIFWCTWFAVLGFSLITILHSGQSAQILQESGFLRTLDDYYFEPVPYIGGVFAIFISLFLGTEHADGTMRNKIIVGHTRTNIYLANYITCFTACACFTVAWFLGGLPGLYVIGPFEMGFSGVLLNFCIAMGFTASFAALYTWISSLSTNRAITVVLLLLLWVAILMSASGINDRLREVEFSGGMAYINGEFVTMEQTPNPLYLSGSIRVFWESVLDLLPTGQTLLMANNEITHPLRQLVSSVGLTVITTWLGLVTFRKKDLK